MSAVLIRAILCIASTLRPCARGSPEMDGLDRSLVAEGYPTEEGLHFLWSDHQGWPVLDVVRVQVTDGIVTWWRGTGGTDRWTEVSKMFQFDGDRYLGSSRITPEIVAHYGALWKRASATIRASIVPACVEELMGAFVEKNGDAR